MERAFLYARLNLWETLSKWKCTLLAARGPWSAFISENPVKLETTALERRGKSRQKPGEMCGFCLPLTPNPVRAVSKVEQNHPELKKYSTRLLSPKQCGLRLRAHLRNHRFACNLTQVQRLSRWCAALNLSKSLSFTDTSLKMDALSVNGLPEKWRLRTKWSKTTVCP